jgi:hypothetical protein
MGLTIRCSQPLHRVQRQFPMINTRPFPIQHCSHQRWLILFSLDLKDMGFVKNLHDLLIVVILVVGLTCLALYVRTIQLRKPGIPLLPSWALSPAFHLFYRERFSEAGLKFRRAFFISLAVLALCLIVDHSCCEIPNRPNHAMQPTASPRTASVFDNYTHSFQISLAVISGG